MIKSSLLAAILCVLAGCSTTIVEQKPWVTTNVSGVRVLPITQDSSIPAGLMSGIKGSVEKNLYSEHGYYKSNELTIEFMVLQEDDPRGFWSAWWNGEFPDGDKEMLNVGVIYSDWSDTQLAEIEVEVEVKSASEADKKKAIETIAEHIRDFTLEYFPNNSF